MIGSLAPIARQTASKSPTAPINATKGRFFRYVSSVLKGLHHLGSVSRQWLDGRVAGRNQLLWRSSMLPRRYLISRQTAEILAELVVRSVSSRSRSVIARCGSLLCDSQRGRNRLPWLQQRRPLPIAGQIGNRGPYRCQIVRSNDLFRRVGRRRIRAGFDHLVTSGYRSVIGVPRRQATGLLRLESQRLLPMSAIRSYHYWLGAVTAPARVAWSG